MLRAERHVHERPPLRTLRPAGQSHVRLVRQAISLPGIACDAGADHVFPRRQAATIAWQDVIEVQVRSLEKIAAILAGVLVALEHIVPGEFYFLLRQPIEEQEHDDARDANLPRDGGNDFMLRRRGGEIAPAIEAVSKEIIRRIRRNDMSVPLVKQGKSTTRRADLDRLPKTVQHEHLAI